MDVGPIISRASELAAELTASGKQGIIFLVLLDEGRNTHHVLLNSEETNGELNEALAQGERPVAFWILPVDRASFEPVDGEFSVEDRAVIDALYVRGEGPGYSIRSKR